MKRICLIPVLIIIVCGLVLSSCAQQAPAPAPAPAPKPAPAPAPVEPIKLRLAHPAPPMTVFHKEIWVPWVKMIEERTTAIGKPVGIVIYPAQTLVKHADAYDACISGYADIVAHLMVDDYEPNGGLLSVIELPFLFPSAEVAGEVAQELWDTIPEVKNETADVKLLWFHPTGPGQIHSREKQVKTREDFKGMKIRASRRTAMDVLHTMGATPVDMLIPEVYIALERGILDGFVNNWEALMAFKIHEVTKCRSEAPKGLWLDLLSIGMNWDTWNSLPPDVQKIFEELSGAYMSKFSGEAMDNADRQLREVILGIDKKAGKPDLYKVPEDEFQSWVAAVNPVYEMWLKRMKDKGLPGEVVLEKARSLAQKYSQ